MTEPKPPRRSLASLSLILPLLRGQRGLLSGWIVFLVLSSAATLSLPVAVRHMIDTGFADPARSGCRRHSQLGLNL